MAPTNHSMNDLGNKVGLIPIPEHTSKTTFPNQRLGRSQSMANMTASLSHASYTIATKLSSPSSAKSNNDTSQDGELGWSFTSDLSESDPTNVGLDLDQSNHQASSWRLDLEGGSSFSKTLRPKLQRSSLEEMVHRGDDEEGTSSSTLRRRVSTTMKKMLSFRRRPKRNSRIELKDNTTAHSSGIQSYGFLKKEDDKGKTSIQGTRKWWHGVFIFSLIGFIACIITLWAPYPIGARMPSAMVAKTPWSDGCQGLESCICPRETICADDLMSMIFLTIARASAWFDYPLYILLFLSKARSLNNFLQKTMLKCWVNFSDSHRVHALFGIIVGIESTSHAIFHLLRWARRKDDIQLLWTHQTGITGLISILLCPFIVLPMTVPLLKKHILFEWRKGLHYLSIVWAVSLMFHAPQRIYWLIGVPLMAYAADTIFGMFKTHLVENAYFERLGDSSCTISSENPPGFGKQNSAYIYIMLPWLSRCQFHAFSVYPCKKANFSQLCISKSGGWTSDLMAEITTPTHKPAFIVGPFLSPFSSTAMNCENLIAVASGIGVTPIISLIKQYLHTRRRLSLIWICRDPGLVEWFLHNNEFSEHGYMLIYYTGKRSLVLEKDSQTNVFIYEGRPNLDRTISETIVSIASGECLPGGSEEGRRRISKSQAPPEARAKLLLGKALSIYTTDQLFNYAMEVSNASNNCVRLEPLVDSVCYQGILSLMQQLIKDGCENMEFMGELTMNFELLSSEDLMDRNGFESFMDLMLREEKSDEQGASTNDLRRLQFRDKCQSVGNFGSDCMVQSEVDSRTKSYLRGDGKFAAKNWSMLYCGGSEPVLNSLKEYKSKHGIALSVEKFDW